MKKIKNDFKQLATKKDLKKFELATRKGLKNLESRFGSRFDGVEKDIHTLMSLYVSMDSRVKNLEENMYTKQDHSKFMILIDEAIWEMRAAQESRILNEKHILLMDDQLDNHEKRLVVLEHK